MSDKKSSNTIWTVPFISIFVVNLVSQMGQYMMNTLIPRYADFLGAGAVAVGTVATIFAVTALGTRPIIGPAIDNFNKKWLLMLSVGITAIAFVIYGLSQNVALLIVGRLIHGIGIGLEGPLALAVAGECLSEKKMSAGIGYFGLGNAVATALGPSIGLSLSESIGYRASFFIGASVVFIACLLSLTLKNSPQSACGKEFRINMRNILAKEAFVPALMILFLSIAYSSISSYLTIYGSARGIGQIGMFFTANAFALLLSRPFSGFLADKYGSASVLFPCFIMFSAAFILISYSYTMPMFVISGVITALGFGTIIPITQAMGMRLVPIERRGVMANTIYTGMDVGFLLGGPLVGFVCESVQKATGDNIFGYSVMFRTMIIPVAIGAAIYFFSLKKERAARKLKLSQ